MHVCTTNMNNAQNKTCNILSIKQDKKNKVVALRVCRPFFPQTPFSLSIS